MGAITAGATSPRRTRRVALITLLERPNQSDREKSLAVSSLGDARTSPERPLGATQRGRSSWERRYGSDREKSLAVSSPGDARTSPERPLAATQRGRSRSLERRAEVAARFISTRICDFSRAFWSFHYARFYFLNLCFNTLGANKRGIIFVLRKTTKNLWKVISLNQLISLLLRILSKLDHPRSNPYIHEFSFPIVKKFQYGRQTSDALERSGARKEKKRQRNKLENVCQFNKHGSWTRKTTPFSHNCHEKSYSDNQRNYGIITSETSSKTIDQPQQPSSWISTTHEEQPFVAPTTIRKSREPPLKTQERQASTDALTKTNTMVLSRSRAWERGLTATPQGRSSWERGFESDTPRSLAFSSSDQEKSPQSEVSERGRKVAPAGSDIMGATPRSRSRFRRNGPQKLTRSDVLERHLEVAPAQSEVSRATLQGRSRFCRNTTRGNDLGATFPSDTLTSLPNRFSLFLTTHSPFPFIQNKPTGSGTQRTVRQQTLAARKSQEQEKRAGKSVAVPTHEESETESADEQAPTKKAKMSKGKGVAVDRDRAKTPSVEELYDHLKNGVTWAPTRFADLDLLKELGLESDIEAMLGHLKMPKLLTMAYPFYKDVTCQFLSSLVVTYHDTTHVRQGWGKITFKVNGREYNMNFKDIGRVMGFQDLEDHSLPKCENLPTELWKLITGNRHSTGADKNSHIRHPSVRYLHRLLVDAFYPRKQAGNVTEEDMRLLCPAIRPYAQPGVLPLPSTDIYATFGMVSFFVGRLEHYRDWAWYTTDLRPKMGIGGMITPLLQFLNVPLGKDAAGPRFIDGTYLRIATYFSGMYGKEYVYHYYLQGKPVEVVLPNRNLTSLEIPGAVSFNIPQEYFLGEHGPLDPIQAASSRRRSVPTQPDSPVADTSEHIYGPPRYYFKPHDGVLPPGALRDAHDHIGRLQRWNKAQDRTIEKLKDKCKALSKTVKKGGIAGCSSADFAFANTSNPQPPPPPDALGSPSLLCSFSVSGGTHPLNLPLPATNPHPLLLLTVSTRLTRLRASHGIGVPHGVLGDTWRHLELKKECLEWSLGEQGMGAASPERRHRVDLITLLERPNQSDREKSLAVSSLGDARTSPERPLGATQRGRSSWERRYGSDREKSLAVSSPGDARTSPERPLAATQRGRSRSLERLVGATG
ncbi:hypothetical protein IGI04_030721 [Brassica rapa subsp. trilocularis]|uniref:Arabidopsis retrotransposon Orf1 C-terminal domain-containing protein n=1 Tax=Brassica rapa subsp. trilocularis TaxID=1813537 RepID=A0ABQ7LT61_BRACM|nr:hypothetical protein IGI04_030721 [Brassica rapa subsp. trilocularis]